MHRRFFGIALFLVIPFLSGCTLFDGFTGIGTAPGTRIVNGTVTFHDTGIPLISTITIEGHNRFVTRDGKICINNIENERSYAWELSTLVGNQRGTLDRWVRTLNVTIPPFSGWSLTRFHELLVTQGRTIRWPDGATVRLWIESPAENGNIAQRHTDMAWNVAKEWESVLGGAIRFVRAARHSDADLSFRFATSKEISQQYQVGEAAGLCVRSWTGVGGSLLAKGEIVIAYQVGSVNVLDNIGVYRHEIGHCIGLNHSSERGMLMHDIVGDWNQAITPVERNFARLLYAAPAGTGSIRSDLFTMTAEHDDHIVYNPDGTVTQIIPTYVEMPQW